MLRTEGGKHSPDRILNSTGGHRKSVNSFLLFAWNQLGLATGGARERLNLPDNLKIDSLKGQGMSHRSEKSEPYEASERQQVHFAVASDAMRALTF